MNILTQRQAARAARQIPFDFKGVSIPPYEVVDGLMRIVRKQLRRVTMSHEDKAVRRFSARILLGLQ